VEDVFWKILAAIGVALLAMMLARIATIAAARRVSYAAIAGRLVEFWRTGSPKKHEIFSEITKLVIDGNRDLYVAIESFVDAVNHEDPAAELRLLELLDAMRDTAALAAVRESFVSSGPSRIDLLAKLLKK
jgi:hypothetical protein